MHPRLATLIATVGGVGFAPKGPGTFGSLAGLVLAWPILAYGGLLALAACTLLFFFLGWWAADAYERQTGRHDPGEIVIDEVVGQWVTLLLGSLALLLIAGATWKGIPVDPNVPSYLTRTVPDTSDLSLAVWAFTADILTTRMNETVWHGRLAWPILHWVGCFSLFRLFDIRKPWLIGTLDREVPGGLGTMLDDVLAGVAAGLAMILIEVGFMAASFLLLWKLGAFQ